MFVTAYDTYALEAFEVCAVDYLLKPFDQERFRKTLARVRPRHAHERRRRPPGAARGPARAAGARCPRDSRRRGRACSPSSTATCTCIDAAQVEMIEADRNYVAIRVGRDSLSRAQHLEPGRTRAALAADAAHQPLLSGQHELRARGQPHAARRLHPGAGGGRHRDQQRGLSRQGQGLPRARLRLAALSASALQQLLGRERREQLERKALHERRFRIRCARSARRPARRSTTRCDRGRRATAGSCRRR